MRKNITATLLMLVSWSAVPSASEEIRLVVSTNTYPQQEDIAYKLDENTPPGNVCINNENGNETWCVPVEYPSHEKSASKLGTRETPAALFQVVSVDGYGYSPEEVRQLFEKSGQFMTVELDVIVRQHDISFNDPHFDDQESYFGSSDEFNNGSHILEALESEGVQVGTSDVIVFDSSFFDNPDIPYASGRSMVSFGGQVRNNIYSPRVDSVQFCNGHGLGVAAVTGAIQNNDLGIVGVMPGARVHVARVLDCGLGRLSDVSAALRYFAGREYEGVDPYEGSPGIINMSLGADVEECPSFMQDAVDTAIDAGFTLVAAAGNNSKDAGHDAPGNCDGVISVGSIDRDGELGDFSNFGSTVDVVAEGLFVASVCEESDVACYWEGTSFSAPLVAGALGYVKQQTNADNDTIMRALSETANTHTLGESCADGNCGDGLLNVKGMLDFVREQNTDADTDADGLTDDEEETQGTDPNNPDSDLDGLSDGLEVNVYGTDPNNTDSDGDGYPDGDEVNKGTSPTDTDKYPGASSKAFTPYDFDGDGKADVAVRRPSNFTHYIKNSSGTIFNSIRKDDVQRIRFGTRETDIPVSGDFDGDGIADIAVRRPSSHIWYIKNSSGVDRITENTDGITRREFGTQDSDIPVPADYDGDGITDIAVRNPSTFFWHILNSTGVDNITNNEDGITRLQFGRNEDDIPVVADYDGDGKADIAVRRIADKTWYIRNSSGVDKLTGNDDGITRRLFGRRAEDIPVPADFDGDGKADLAVRRPSTQLWYVLNSSGSNFNSDREDGIQRVHFGRRAEDIPIVADYDGDGIADFAVRRPSTYFQYVLQSRDGNIMRLNFGKNSDDISLASPVSTRMAITGSTSFASGDKVYLDDEVSSEWIQAYDEQH